MPTPKQQLDKLARLERWQFFGGICLGLGLVALFTALISFGLGSLSPKSAASTFNAFVLAGFLRPFAWPLAIIGAGAIAFGAVASWRSQEIAATLDEPQRRL